MTPLVRRLLAGIDRPVLRVVAAVLLAAGASAASVALMGVSAWLLSRAAELPPVMYLTAAAVGVRFFGISRGVLRYVERLVGHDLGLRLQSALRLQTYSRLAETTLLGRRRGDLLTRVVADVDAILDLVVRVFVPFASGGVVIVATTVILGVFSPGSAAVLFASALFAGALAPWLAARLSRRADADALPARGELANLVHELARTAGDLVAFGADAAYLARLADADARLRRAEQRAAWSRALATTLQVIAAGIAVVAALVIGGQAVLDGRLDRTMLAVLCLTPLALHEVLGDFAKAAQTYTRATVALARVEAVLDADPVGVGDLAAGALADDADVTLDGVSLGWPGGETLHDGINLRLRRGERVAVVGPSGSGKTTLAATVLGLIPPHAGTVETHGRIGYLAQDAHTFSTTVAENVKIGNRDATPDQVTDALARVRLDTDPTRLVGELGTPLSGGEDRRLALARLAVGDYQVLVLDEPSEHLDAATATALLDDIWQAAGDAPLLVITHDPDVIARCDRQLHLTPRST